VTQVNASAPLLVANATTTPTLSIARATNVADGYLAATDWTAFNAKQSRVTGTCASASFIRAIASDGSVTCDSAPAVTAGTGLVSSGNQLSANLPTSGGRQGTSSQLARADHSHAIRQVLTAGDFEGSGAPTRVSTNYNLSVPIPAWRLPVTSGNTCISTNTVIPPGVTTPPTVRVYARGSAAGEVTLTLDAQTVLANAFGPISISCPQPQYQSATYDFAGMNRRFTFALSTLTVCGSTVSAGPGDLLLLHLCNAGPTTFSVDVTTAEIVWD
jgi:hypothetical protein